MYPTKMEANGRVYNINTDYKVALACLKAIDDDEITDLERFYAIETLLLGEDVLFEDENILRKKIELYLRCGKEENIKDDEIDMDFFQDETIIKTSIRQCYHIDLNKIDYMHWWEYNELITGLTSESVLNKTRELRTYDTSHITDQKEKDRIENAKKHVALKDKTKKVKLTDEQMKNIEDFYKQMGEVRKEVK